MWGPPARCPGQRVGCGHVVQDGEHARHPFSACTSMPSRPKPISATSPGADGATRTVARTARDRVWAIDRYADEDERRETWFVEGVRKYHRRLSTLVNGLVDAGFVVERVIEPVPRAEWLARARPDAVDEARRPMFVLLRASLGTPAARP
ncbi:MAG: hypothetical protein M3336_11570 [Chloroflexota bacterium]|nr:hypothetical protein [Chloroflexota bacterium]